MLRLSPYYQRLIGQIEIVLAPCYDLCHVADSILILNIVSRRSTMAKGLSVSFSAKPKHYLSGNGLHCHISIEDNKSENLFKKDETIFKGGCCYCRVIELVRYFSTSS